VREPAVWPQKEFAMKYRQSSIPKTAGALDITLVIHSILTALNDLLGGILSPLIAALFPSQQ
jgi:hypothetical protein